MSETSPNRKGDPSAPDSVTNVVLAVRVEERVRLFFGESGRAASRCCWVSAYPLKVAITACTLCLPADADASSQATGLWGSRQVWRSEREAHLAPVRNSVAVRIVASGRCGSLLPQGKLLNMSRRLVGM